MTTYYCKCGRVVRKATGADNTGNRDTEGCTGCPYLMPWGPTKWDETRRAFVADVKGYECRMSKDIEYATRFGGSVQDKGTCYIASLDFDFLERVSAWIAEVYPNREIFGHFDRATIRPVEYVSNGRYRMSICCAKNRKGIAAKAALLEQFFHLDGRRKDMDPETEKRLILERIEAGKAAAQKKEGLMNPKQYQNEYGTVYAVREKNGIPRLMHRVKDAEEWLISSTLAPYVGDAKTSEELQATLDKAAEEKGWTLWEPNQPAPTGAAAATTDGSAAPPDSAEGTSTISTSEEAAPTSTPGASLSGHSSGQGCPADSEAAPSTPSDLSTAAPATLAADTLPAFDYIGLDANTQQIVRANTTEFCRHMMVSAQEYANACINVVNIHAALSDHYQGKWGEWCTASGLSHGTAQRMVDVGRNLLGDTKLVQLVSDGKIGKSLLQAVSIPSAPAELVQAVKSGDITTHKQYQDLLAQLNAEKARAEGFAQEVRTRDAKITELLDASEQAEREREEAVTHIKAARDMQIDTAHERDAALRRAAEAEKALEGSRQVADAARLRADKLQADNDALRAQAQAAPATVEAKVVDPDEVARLADEKARALLAQWQAEQPAADTGEALHNAYDAAILFARQMDTAWQMFRPHLAALRDEDARQQALGRITQKWDEIYEEMMEQCP